MSKLKKQEKRDLKYLRKSTWEFSAIRPYFIILSRPKTFKAGWRFIFTVIKNFFIIQELQVLHITHRPVIKVDHRLDEKIPFDPSKIDIYMSFVSYFVKPLDMLIKRFGYKKAIPYLKEELFYLTETYKMAASIYRFSMTTTNRPDYKENKAFKTIHAADPHLLCVPSLHVAICTVIYAFYKSLFERQVFPQEEAERRLKEIKERAIAIIESVLFVKQHSVNCIPTAIYMINAIFGDKLFSANEAIELINELFVNATEINSETKKELNDYFTLLFERNYLENNFNENWQESIKRWLSEYAKKTGQILEI